MKIEISYQTLESFVGDVRPLWLKSDVDLKFKGIVWSIKGDAVVMKKCDGFRRIFFKQEGVMIYIQFIEIMIYEL